MKRAMAKQAEAERERRAKVVNAEGEFQAAEKMVQAAAMMSKEPIALQLRFLQTMREISSEHNTTTFFPIPIDLLSLFSNKKWARQVIGLMGRRLLLKARKASTGSVSQIGSGADGVQKSVSICVICGERSWRTRPAILRLPAGVSIM